VQNHCALPARALTVNAENKSKTFSQLGLKAYPKDGRPPGLELNPAGDPGQSSQ